MGLLTPDPDSTDTIEEVNIKKCGVCKERARKNRVFGFSRCDHALVLCDFCEGEMTACPFRCDNSIKKLLRLRELA